MTFHVEAEIPFDSSDTDEFIRQNVTRWGAVVEKVERYGNLWRVTGQALLMGRQPQEAHGMLEKRFDRDGIRSRWRKIRDDWDMEFNTKPVRARWSLAALKGSFRAET